MPNNLPKIDIHCHTTNRLLNHTLKPNADIITIAKEMNSYNIFKAILLATYFPNRGSGISNYRLFNWIKKSIAKSYFEMFGALDFEHYFNQGYNELEEMAEQKLIKGIKIYTGYQKITSDKLYQILNLCRSTQLPVMFHTGECTQLHNVHAYIEHKHIEKFQDVTFILSHMAHPDTKWIIDTIKKFPNVYTDMSGLLNSKTEHGYIPTAVATIKEFCDSCGCDKLMFGTDFPVQSHEDSIHILDSALMGTSFEKDLPNIYYDTAAKILGI